MNIKILALAMLIILGIVLSGPPEDPFRDVHWGEPRPDNDPLPNWVYTSERVHMSDYIGVGGK